MRILVLGATGFLGGFLFEALREEHVVHGTHRRPCEPATDLHPLDLADADETRSLLARSWDIVVHCAGVVDVDACARDPETAWRVNVEGTANVARFTSAKVVFMSTDYVFGGASASFAEDDPPDPINVYGRQKLEAERRLLETDPAHLVLRLPMLYGAGPARDAFLDRFKGPEITAPHPVWCNPLYLDDVLLGLRRLRGRGGVVHLGGATVVRRYAFYVATKNALGLRLSVRTAPWTAAEPGARRPPVSILTSTRTPFRGRSLSAGLAATARAIAARASPSA